MKPGDPRREGRGAGEGREGGTGGIEGRTDGREGCDGNYEVGAQYMHPFHAILWHGKGA